MSTERRRHFRYYRLSPKARDLVDRLLDDPNQTYSSISSAVRAETGERFATSSIQRWAAYVRHQPNIDAISLEPQGSDFQKEVLDRLVRIEKAITERDVR